MVKKKTIYVRVFFEFFVSDFVIMRFLPYGFVFLGQKRMYISTF